MIKLFLAVTADRFELPVGVADTATELAEMMGTTRHTLCSSLSRGQNGSHTGIRYYTVFIEENNDETD